MNNKKLLVGLAVAAAIVAALFFGYKHLSDNPGEPNQPAGQAVEITLDNWKAEVDDLEETQPVLVFFTNSSAGSESLETVKSFAQKNGSVKVVIVNCDHRELLPLASKYDVSVFPGYRVLHKGNAYKPDTADGTMLEAEALKNLVDSAR